MDSILMIDNGGRRSKGDRRAFSYAIHVPERRYINDRRSGFDRRDKYLDHKGDTERRQIFE